MEFYFDRPFYFSIQGIKHLFEKHNLYINKIEQINPHGGSLRFYICKTNNNSSSIEKSIKLEKEYFLNILSQNFHNKSLSEANKLRDFLVNLKRNNKKVIGFGCPARLATITNFADISQISSHLLLMIVQLSNLNLPLESIYRLSRDFLYKFQPEIIIVFVYEYFKSILTTAQFNADHYKPIPLLKLNTNVKHYRKRYRCNHREPSDVLDKFQNKNILLAGGGFLGYYFTIFFHQLLNKFNVMLL